MKIDELPVIAFLFTLFLAFAQLASHALDREDQGTKQMIQKHKFEITHGE